MPDYHPVTHVIFDFDGLLIDTEPAFTKANELTLAKYGKQFSMEIKAAQMGRKLFEAIELLLEMVDLKGTVTPQDYFEDYGKHLEELTASAPSLPGAERLVRHLAKHNIPVAICTGSNADEYKLKSQIHKSWLDLIPLVVLTGSDPAVKKGKPAPDGYLETMKRFSVPPASAKNVLVFEDAPNGVKSALAAGMQCVQVPTSPDPVFRMGAEIDKQITVLRSLTDVDLTVFGLPALD